ncbi:MAG: LPS assembly protein LptD [Desulfobacterales bacterium]|nr:LPS assembly protein LptD [Desulfobacterales bacterium]
MPHNRPQSKNYSCVYRLIGTYRLFSSSFRYIIPPLFLVFLIIIATARVSFAQSPERMFDDDPAEPWYITADEVSFDKKTNQHIAKGNVVITKQDKRLTADFVRFDDKTMEMLAVGHVIMTVGEDVLVGDKMDMDMEAEIGTAYNGTIFIKQNHFYIRGDKIQKTGKSSYAVAKGSLTTCDGDSPAWKITGRNLKVTMEGYGFVKHAALWAKKVPVLYTPFLVFPAKTKRQSGLLPPQILYSERKWEEYIQPFYWAINESSDATLYYHHIGRRGEKIGFEYRYVLDEKSKGTMMYDFLRDRRVDNGTLESSEEWGYADVSGLRPNTDRYWFRMKHDQALPFDFNAKLDIDIVSDQDYLHEFKDGYTGFEKTDKFFNKSFGRDLDEYDDSTRINSLSINKSWSQFSLNAETRWYDNVITRRQEETDTTLQMLPIVDFNASRQQLFGTPFYFDLDSEYTYFYREDDSEAAPRAHRIDAYPRLYLPLQFKHYLSFEPSVGFRETAWYFDKEEYSSSDKATLYREMYDVKLDLSSNIYKIYNLQTSWINKIKHAITPQVTYQYIPGKDQSSKYPQFDAIDNIARTNLVTYSLTNVFTSKSQINNAKKDGKDESGKDETSNYTYNQFCRLKLEQSYNINEAKEDTPSQWANQKEKRPFSTIYGEIEITPVKYVSAQADATWCQYDSLVKSRNVAVTLSDERGDKLFVEHRYTYNSSESIYTDITLAVTDQLNVYADYERNLYSTQDIRKSVGCLYKAQCWSIDFNYADEDNDRKYSFIISLYGIGEFGRDIAGGMMEEPL